MGAGSRYRSTAAGARAAAAGSVMLRAEVRGSQHRLVKTVQLIFRLRYATAGTIENHSLLGVVMDVQSKLTDYFRLYF